MVFYRTTAMGTCPGGLCDFIKDFSEALVVILALDALIFLITILPPIFSWHTKKPDGKKRIWFATLACVTFYFWLAFLALNTIYCFGFIAHEGPCKFKASTGTTSGNTSSKATFRNSPLAASLPSSIPTFALPELSTTTTTTTTTSSGKRHNGHHQQQQQHVGSNGHHAGGDSSLILPTWSSATMTTNEPTIDPPLPPTPTSHPGDQDPDYMNGTEDYGPGEWQQQQPPEPDVEPLITWTASNSTKTCSMPAGEHESQLKNLTLVNILIIVVLVLVLLANAREAITSKALYHKEMLCKKDEVQKFLSSLVMKPPEVGHLVNCFHMAKLAIDPKKKAAAQPVKDPKASGAPRKVITFSAIENFQFQSWRDFSDLRLIEPSTRYPIIEVEIVLNFFPGDHYTAERYKEFVQHLTKQHQSKDAKISIDDYFHVEDHREWTFFIGNPDYIVPWWDKLPAKLALSCFFLVGWPLRMAYKGRIGKHVVEVKKAVFVEPTSQDEGVSLTATPGSSAHNNEHSGGGNPCNNTAAAAAVAAKSNEVDYDNSNKVQSGKSRDASVDSMDNSGANEVDVVTNDGGRNRIPQQQQQQQQHHQHQPQRETAFNGDVSMDDIELTNRSNQKTEHRVDAVISCPPRDSHSPEMASWQYGGMELQQQHQLQQQQQFQRLPPQHYHNPAQERVVQELQHHIQQQQQHQNRYQYAMPDISRNPVLTGPSLPTTLGSSFGRSAGQPMPVAAGYALGGHNHPLMPATPPMPPQRSAPLTSPRTHIRETTKEIVTAVAHSDINGLSSNVNTVALKDIDIQLTALSGYETYV